MPNRRGKNPEPAGAEPGMTGKRRVGRPLGSRSKNAIQLPTGFFASSVKPRTSIYFALPARGRAGFTLVELLVVMTIIAALAGMILTASQLAVDAARLSVCASNLRQIGQAAVLYEGDYNSMPLGDLPVSLKPYDGNRDLYLCPQDPVRPGDSFSTFYVNRPEQDTDSVVLSCSRHRGGRKGPVLFGMGVVRVSPLEPIYDHSGNLVVPGTEVATDTLTFADSSEAKVTGSGAMVPLVSFRQAGGSLCSLVKVKKDHHCKVTSTVTPGSGFEVVTPSATAAALGTKFDVTVGSNPAKYTCDLSVTAGTVDFRQRSPKSPHAAVPAGQNRSIEQNKNFCPD